MASPPENLNQVSAAYCLQTLFPQHVDKLNGSFNVHRPSLERRWCRSSIGGLVHLDLNSYGTELLPLARQQLSLHRTLP